MDTLLISLILGNDSAPPTGLPSPSDHSSWDLGDFPPRFRLAINPSPVKERPKDPIWQEDGFIPFLSSPGRSRFPKKISIFLGRALAGASGRGGAQDRRETRWDLVGGGKSFRRRKRVDMSEEAVREELGSFPARALSRDLFLQTGRPSVFMRQGGRVRGQRKPASHPRLH